MTQKQAESTTLSSLAVLAAQNFLAVMPSCACVCVRVSVCMCVSVLFIYSKSLTDTIRDVVFNDLEKKAARGDSDLRQQRI